MVQREVLVSLDFFGNICKDSRLNLYDHCELEIHIEGVVAMRLAYATDFHGHIKAMEEFFRLATARAVDAVVVGGDLTPKKLAVRLPVADDFDDGGVASGGEIIPFDALKSNAVTKTFSASLSDIAAHNQTVGREAYQRELTRSGTIVHSETNGFYELQSMLLEQQVLDVLHAWTRAASRKERYELSFSEEALQVVVTDCLPAWFAELEAGWSESAKLDFVRKVRNRPEASPLQFRELAPSQQIVSCIMNELYGREVIPRLQQWLKDLASDHPADGFLRCRLEDLLYGLINAGNYRPLITEEMIEGLTRFTTIEQLRRKWSTPEHYAAGQRRFVEQVFLPLICDWRQANDGKPVGVILGNDDDVSVEPLLIAAHHRQELVYSHYRVDRFAGDYCIAGCNHVAFLPECVTYRQWLLSEEEMAAGLSGLHDQAECRPFVLVCHAPPYGVLDQMKDGHGGSHSLRAFIERTQPPLVLVGHIHEAPRLAGTNADRIGKTLVVNPGGEHDLGLQAVVIDTDIQTVEPL